MTSPRKPSLVRPRRMDRLAVLPVFLKLEGQRAIVIGGSEAAVWKAELLSAAGAHVEVWDPEPGPDMRALAAGPPGGPVVLQRQPWRQAPLAGSALVVAAARDEPEATDIRRAAQAAGVPVNVIDRPAFCTFQFGAIVNRSPLVVGISTDGAAPVFAQAIRSRIEALLPAGFARWAAAAKTWRAEIGERLASPDMRRRFWEGFVALALQAPGRLPDAKDRAELLKAARTSGGGLHRGHVALVGAGPGDPELLTLKAVRALRTADVILFDDLVAPEILDFARREARRILVGKTGHAPSCRQEDVIALILLLARSGKHVVRLKSGDPLIFGRASEEITALEQAGIACEVISGISAAQAAAAQLKVSLTERTIARRVQFVTAHAKDGKLPQDLDADALADERVTTAVYMPLGQLRAFATRALDGGADPDRPACAVFNASRPSERTVWGTLSTIGDLAARCSASGPCLVIVGQVLRGRMPSRAVLRDATAHRPLAESA